MSDGTVRGLGLPCWIDAMSMNIEQAKDFYGKIFGWDTRQAMEWESEGTQDKKGEYIIFTSDGKDVAGISANTPESGYPDVWTTYFATDNIAATCAKISEAGGMILLPHMEVTSFGSMAIAADPSGAVFGLWQANIHKGYQAYDETNAPVWHELLTKNYKKALDFYIQVFGWKTSTMSDTEDFRYTQVLDSSGNPVMGVMDAAQMLPEQAPSNWSNYFGVKNTDETITKIVDCGGSIVIPAQDSPYGRFAFVTDPTGANFCIISDSNVESSK